MTLHSNRKHHQPKLADMESVFPFSESATIIILALVALPLIYLFGISNKRLLPPEAAGGWPIIGHLRLLGGSQLPHITLGNMADKIGPIFTVKFGVHRALVISSWELAKECLTTNDKVFVNRPKSLAMEILGYNFVMFSASPYGEYWRHMRKMVTHEVLSNYRLELVKHVRESEVKAAIQGLYKEWMVNHENNSSNKISVEMIRWFSDITLNLMFKIVLGKRYVEYYNKGDQGNKDTTDDQEWRNAVRDFFKFIGKFVVSDAFPFLRWLDLGGDEKAMRKTAKELDHIIDGWLQEHKQKKASGTAKMEEEDFMDVLLSALDGDSKELCNQDIDTINKSTCMALVLAGSDTSAVTLTWTLSLLLNNRDVLKKAQQELDTHVGKERLVNESDVKNLVYLQAIIKESFRLYPAGPLSQLHESIEDCTVGGYHIPKGTRLILNISRIQRDSRVWSNPLEFKPERFLTTHKDVDVKGNNFELLPFGSGRRICPGLSFALQVLNLTLASLLQAFDIETPSGQEVDMSESVGLTNLKATPLDTLLTPRLPAHLY